MNTHTQTQHSNSSTIASRTHTASYSHSHIARSIPPRKIAASAFWHSCLAIAFRLHCARSFSLQPAYNRLISIYSNLHPR